MDEEGNPIQVSEVLWQIYYADGFYDQEIIGGVYTTAQVAKETADNHSKWQYRTEEGCLWTNIYEEDTDEEPYFYEGVNPNERNTYKYYVTPIHLSNVPRNFG